MRILLIATILCCQLLLGGCAAVMTAAATHATAIAAAVDVAPLVLATGAIGALGVMGAAGDDRALHEPGTLGAFLKGKQSEADLLVQTGMKSQKEGLVASGLQTHRAIARAQIAYRDSLDTKDAALGNREKAFEAEIDAIVSTLASGDDGAKKQAGDRAQGIADRLSLPEEAPQLRSYGPLYLFSFLPFQTVSIRGIFPSAYKDGVVPRLAVNGKSYAAYSYSTDSLDFSVPTGALIAGDAPGDIAWTTAGLSIPWDQPLFGPLARDRHTHFVVIGVLPDSPGRATIDHTVSTARIEERTRTSDEFALKPELDPGQTRCLELSAQELAEGWRIVKGSGKATLSASTPGSGAHDHGLHSEDGGSVCWSASAAEDPIGKVPSWRISARIQREVADARTASEIFDMKWAENRTFPYPPGTWKVRYSLFNRSAIEVSNTEQSNPLVRVDSDARGVTIRTYPF